MMECYVEPPNRPEARDVFELLLLGAAEAHEATNIPPPEPETAAKHLLDLWRNAALLVTAAREGGPNGVPVAVMGTTLSRTVLGADLMLILVRYTHPSFRRKGIGDLLSDFTDTMYKERGVNYALSVVVPETPGHAQMAKRGVEYRQWQGIRRL